MHILVSYMNWQNSWEKLNPIDGGAQGDCFLVKRKSGDATPYFLKQLKDGNNKERRERFCLETIIHKTFKINNTTEIVETNAEQFENKSLVLYYVAEYVHGQRLDKYLQSQDISEQQAMEIFRQLLNILVECHSREVVHRDIKPENIIINEGIVHLVDFGIASSSLRESDTKVGQEVGNRFLRLPEFAAGSANKRDIRSDITLACGIALYLLNKTYPRVLQSDNGLYPHQTNVSVNALAGLTHKVIWNSIFDRAFVPNLSSRWNCCEDILKMLDNMNRQDKSDIEALKTQLESYSKKYNTEYLSQLSKDLHTVFNVAFPIIKKICYENSSGFNIQESATVYNRGDVVKQSQIRFHQVGDVKKYLPIILSVKLLGEQIICLLDIDCQQIEISRTSTKIDTYSVSIDRDSVERVVLSALVNYAAKA